VSTIIDEDGNRSLVQGRRAKAKSSGRYSRD
jgi:hypothetical protein